MNYLFLVDTNFFIQAHRVSYPFDVVPSFWNKVKDLADNDKIFSIDKVKDEIYINEDDLKKWCQSNPYALADPTTRVVVTYEIADKKKSIIKIPNVCAEFKIRYLDPISMFRELNESF